MASRSFLWSILSVLTIYLSAQQAILLPHAWESSYRIIISKNSTLKIHGKTNVNKFLCGYEGQIAADTLYVHSLNTDEESIIRKASLRVAVNDFDCGMKQMTNDMMDLLKEDQFPNLTVTVINLKKKGHMHEAQARFQIAGKSKDYYLPLTTKGVNGWTYCVGRNTIDIRDFGLEPPSKFLGAVRVKETIEVEFNLILKIVEVK